MKQRIFLATALLSTVVVSIPAWGDSKLPPLVSPFERGTIQTRSVEHRAPEVPRGDAFNWIVSLGHKGMNHALGGHFCGGSVIGKRWILTAAHCLKRLNDQGNYETIAPDEIQIKTGYELHQGVAIYQAEELILHGEFAVTAFNSTINDIALIKTDKEIAQVGIVNILRPIDAPQVADNVVVLGWGKPGNQTNYLSQRLRFLQLNQIDGQECNDKHYQGLIDEKMICAVGNGTDACQGDSGGPLVGFDSLGNIFLYGIVSWGDQCGESLKPGIYASAPAYYDWIVQNAASN